MDTLNLGDIIAIGSLRFIVKAAGLKLNTWYIGTQTGPTKLFTAMELKAIGAVVVLKARVPRSNVIPLFKDKHD